MLERLTMRRDNEVFVNSEVTGWTHSSNWSKPAKEAIDRLAAYEDTGLSPEQVQELAKAKADGRLVVLPCKAGDVVWKTKAVFSYFPKPVEDRVERIVISSNEILVCCTSGTKFSVNSIGKTVFLSREEAEKALEVKEP